MIKFDVMDRFIGKVKFTAEIDCDEDAPTSIKKGLAVQWRLCKNANLYNADLYNADLRRADLRRADLRNADLRRADLYNADLRRADLRNADLRNADLRNADLRWANLNLGKNIGARVIFMSHLNYHIFAYAANRKGKIAMCMDIGGEKHTVKVFKRKYKNGDFDDYKDFIKTAMPYIDAVITDLERIKKEVGK